MKFGLRSTNRTDKKKMICNENNRKKNTKTNEQFLLECFLFFSFLRI